MLDIILFRHGQKGVAPFEDPHLTASGFQQAKSLTQLVEKKHLPKPSELWASEKIRTVQTFSDLSQNLKLQIQIKPELNVRGDFENQKNFRQRVQNLIQVLQVSSETNTVSQFIFLCTHYDWIEEALGVIQSNSDLKSFEFSHWAPAQFIHFKLNEGLWTVHQKGRAL